jgi:hypothetical protein
MQFTAEQIDDIKKMFVYIENPPEFKFKISNNAGFEQYCIKVDAKEYGMVFNDAHTATIKRILDGTHIELVECGHGRDYDGWPTKKLHILCW